jgi:pimeloyl-ACP methyl ester carboxylesterase
MRGGRASGEVNERSFSLVKITFSVFAVTARNQRLSYFEQLQAIEVMQRELLILRPSKPKPTGVIGLTREQAEWMQSILAANRAPAMRGAFRGLITFDSRPWLNEIRAPTLVVGGTHDNAVPRHHFDTLVSGIPGAIGRLVGRAGHTLVWTHTREFADII